MATALPVRRTTSTARTPAACSSALSTLALSAKVLPPRRPSSAVTTTVEPQSVMRLAMLSGEKPPNTTECTAPIRAQASMA